MNALDYNYWLVSIFCAILAGGALGLWFYVQSGSPVISGVVCICGVFVVFACLRIVLEGAVVRSLVKEEFNIDLSYFEAKKLAFLFNGSLRILSGPNKGKQKSREQYIADAGKFIKNGFNDLVWYAYTKAGYFVINPRPEPSKTRPQSGEESKPQPDSKPEIDRLLTEWELPQNFTRADLKKKVRVFYKKYHPDTAGGSADDAAKAALEKEFLKIRAQYEALEKYLQWRNTNG